MLLKKQLVMTIGMTQNNWELTREMVENSLDSFRGKPIIWNKLQKFKDYTNMIEYDKLPIIGITSTDIDDIVIEGNNVYTDLIIHEKYIHLWRGHFNNWCVQFNDDKTAFVLDSIEVF